MRHSQEFLRQAAREVAIAIEDGDRERCSERRYIRCE